MNQNVNSRVRVLFVCMGNICRSPTAQGVFTKLVIEEGLSDRIEIDSAGTHAYHVGEPPDPRARETARRRGIDLSRQRARRALAEDFERFDYVLAMDEDNHRNLSALCPPGFEERLRLFMDFAPQLGRREVPDPYYGGTNGFDAVFDMVDEAARGLLEAIRRERIESVQD
ncbi:low molecular weight protein-tyrosine-phosphatase [Lamprobacter modestohalophilus]|uniref:low molecular weight protein-tyrosine-phosphatase n=1 Tax=Lamprobacter modestohalophilus TaxID=1064514 RepID=UPI002ADEC8A1|nr:low molecular weight protein-tyrosine-phosphatase [Lamprobacter modestohalophilus]MEA1051037.1 low molecular weight protein-tyrosine-phosphatase [Lamprobacter modestohalophilus]